MDIVMALPAAGQIGGVGSGRDSGASSFDLVKFRFQIQYDDSVTPK
jgi:hypothetical protein